MSIKHDKLIEMIETGYDISVCGHENITDGPTLYVANHNGMMDIFFLPYAIPSPISMLISSRLAFKLGERKEFIDEHLDVLPLEVHAGKEYSAMSLSLAAKSLSNGQCIGMFPEGVYTDEPVVHKSHTGMARILIECLNNGVYVNLVPVAIDYKPSGDLDYYGSESDDKVMVHILPSISYTQQFEEYISTNDYIRKNEILHEIVDCAMMSIAECLGVSYTDSYIELYPKKTIILPDGVEVPKDKVPPLDEYVLILKKRGYC